MLLLFEAMPRPVRSAPASRASLLPRVLTSLSRGLLPFPSRSAQHGRKDLRGAVRGFGGLREERISRRPSNVGGQPTQIRTDRVPGTSSLEVGGNVSRSRRGMTVGWGVNNGY